MSMTRIEHMALRQNGGFLRCLFQGGDAPLTRQSMDTTRGDEIRANLLYWFEFEFELRQYTSLALDTTRLLVEENKFIPVADIESGSGSDIGPIACIAAMLGKDVRRISGDHVPYKSVLREFSTALHHLLSET